MIRRSFGDETVRIPTAMVSSADEPALRRAAAADADDNAPRGVTVSFRLFGGLGAADTFRHAEVRRKFPMKNAV
jgi:hypothetical protein